ncbi:MAG: ABC transporter ATP-binding protein [Bacteroidia bacterium]|jgi:lipoprotein-releasing system ATP-binding protein|nr:ABC transporter ATP-binding protein [Bacteroidia bacterium]
MIELKGIRKKYRDLEVLKGIDLFIPKGEMVAVVGASGAGKTTLLQIAGTLDKPDSGSVFINQTNVSALNDKKLAAFRNKEIGFIFQFHQLLPEFTALENVMFPAWIGNKPNKVAEKRACDLLDFLKLTHRLHHKPSELSGGEQQRVAVARALMNEPSVVFADEPSGNLDSANAHELHELFNTLKKEFNQTFVIVTHNDALSNLADRTLVMKDGVISA